MFVFNYLLSSLFLFPAFFSFASPTIDIGRSNLVRRAQYCSNAPAVVAGTQMPISAGPPLYPLAHIFNVIWCIPNTETYLSLNFGSPIASGTINNLLTGASRAVAGRIAAQGDGMLQDGAFTWFQRGDSHVMLRVLNANNHQITYGVLGSALTGLQSYMWNVGYWSVQFQLYDGKNLVGQGSIGYD